MNNPLFSIIVPIFNVERYIHRCIESVLSQTYEDIEVILVDDGSTDNCPKICDEYSQIDKRIKVIHKKNGGLSDARNTGLLEAKGCYILFLDSDDYLEKEACEVLSQYINLSNEHVLPDIIVGNAKMIMGNRITYMRSIHNTHPKYYENGTEFLKEQLVSKSICMAAWLNIYRRDFLIQNNLFFKFGILHEDEQWTPRVFLIAQKVIDTGVFFYNYEIREGSITRSKDMTKNGLDIIDSVFELETIFEKVNDKTLKTLFNDYLVTLYLKAVFIGKLHKKKYRKYLERKILLEKAATKRNRYKLALLQLSPSIYFYTYWIYKMFTGKF